MSQLTTTYLRWIYFFTSLSRRWYFIILRITCWIILCTHWIILVSLLIYFIINFTKEKRGVHAQVPVLVDLNVCILHYSSKVASQSLDYSLGIPIILCSCSCSHKTHFSTCLPGLFKFECVEIESYDLSSTTELPLVYISCRDIYLW